MIDHLRGDILQRLQRTINCSLQLNNCSRTWNLANLAVGPWDQTLWDVSVLANSRLICALDS